MLNKKKMTKLLDADFRKTILSKINLQDSSKNKKIPSYARYVVDTQIINRDKKFKDDKKAYYGFSPIYPLCAIMKDDSFDKRFFEFNIVNHFLVKMEGEKAVEVVECMLIEWCKENKDIKDFDIDKIDAELAKIEHEYVEEQKKKKAKDEKINSIGKEIQLAVQPVIESMRDIPYEEASVKLQSEINIILNRFKENKKIFKHVIDLSRNTSEIISRHELFVDIGFNVEENDQLVVLVCHLNPTKENGEKTIEQTTTETVKQNTEDQKSS